MVSSFLYAILLCAFSKNLHGKCLLPFTSHYLNLYGQTPTKELHPSGSHSSGPHKITQFSEHYIRTNFGLHFFQLPVIIYLMCNIMGHNHDEKTRSGLRLLNDCPCLI